MLRKGSSTHDEPIPDALPSVSVITPSYNQAPFLRRCIDSVLAQGYPRLEHVVMDGGSTDGSVPILASYGEAIRWRSGPDGGQASAINRGIRATTGEYVLWLNSDDELRPGALRALARCAASNPDADLVYARADMIDASGATIRPYPTFAFTRADLKRKCYICQPSVLIRRSALERVGLLSEALDLCFDYELWLRIGREGRLAFCDEVVAASRHYGQTKTASRRLRGLVEAGYLMRAHFGVAGWRWSAKWVVHRWTLDRRRFVLPVAGQLGLIASAWRYRKRFDARRTPSVRGRRLLAALERPPVLRPVLGVTPAPEPKGRGAEAPSSGREASAGAAAS
ncbi:MAG: glycosyltransferase family 2 protein [Phycisphaerales bacterium JB059]